jgi:hypothetical protein
VTDSVQSLVGSWWTSCELHPLTRGQLVRAFVPHVDQQPYTIIEQARSKATEHGTMTFKIGPASIREWKRKAALPVAGLPLHEGESRTVHRAKVRPCLVICEGGAPVDKRLRPSTSARWTSAPTFLVAPYYGTERTGDRGGWYAPFVDRIRACEYPQYILDELPLPGAKESVLRLDHIQPIGDHHDYYEPLPHKLSEDALGVVDEWLGWLFAGALTEDSTLGTIRGLLLSPGSAW